MSAVRRWGVLGNLQEWSSHCYFSGNLGAPAGPEPGSFPPLYLLSAALWRPGVEAGKRTFRNSADVVFPRKERFSGQRQSLYLSKPDSQGSKLGPWQTATGAIIWQMRLGISEAAEELWVPGNSTLRQAGGGTQSKPPLPPPTAPGYTSWARGQFSGHLGKPEPLGKPPCSSSSVGVYVTFISSA